METDVHGDEWLGRLRLEHERHAGVPDFGFCPGRVQPTSFNYGRPDPHNRYDTFKVISSDALAIQRREFVLDSYEGRPFHFLAKARVARGLPWDKYLGMETMLRVAARQQKWQNIEGEVARVTRMYPSEVPFELMRDTDGIGSFGSARWAEALRRGK